MKKSVITTLAAMTVFAAASLSMACAEGETEYPVLTGEVGQYAAGVYQESVRGMGGKMTVNVTFGTDSLDAIEVIHHTETPNIGTKAIEKVIPAMIEAQSAEVDALTGATITSEALKKAVSQAIDEAAAADAQTYAAGVYEEKVRGMGGYMKVQVTVNEAGLENIEVISHTETPNIGTKAIEKVIPAMIEAKSADVDSLTGATITSEALKKAVAQALEEAASGR